MADAGGAEDVAAPQDLELVARRVAHADGALLVQIQGLGGRVGALALSGGARGTGGPRGASRERRRAAAAAI